MEFAVFYNADRLSAAPLVATQVSLHLSLGVAALQGYVEVSLHLGVPFFYRLLSGVSLPEQARKTSPS